MNTIDALYLFIVSKHLFLSFPCHDQEDVFVLFSRFIGNQAIFQIECSVMERLFILLT